MRLFCRKDHDDRKCPSGPVHKFIDGGWTTTDNGIGCFWCERCGDVRQLMPASISAPELEVMTMESDAHER